MTTPRAIGLGEPKKMGKKALFLPPAKEGRESKSEEKGIESKPQVPRMRLTLELTRPALAIILGIQNKYRLRTGKALPKWKILSEAIEQYAQLKQGKKHEPTGE
ncbi:MAG: hypothetical protein IH859_08080 [Chloroflexi bacterium]|nr:hypothetical protein [Chloroflexota bacterium]